MINEGREDNTK